MPTCLIIENGTSLLIKIIGIFKKYEKIFYVSIRDIYYAKYYGKGGEIASRGKKMKLGVKEKK